MEFKGIYRVYFNVVFYISYTVSWWKCLYRTELL